jgi:hypothetical protein
MGSYFVIPFTYEDVQESRDVDFHFVIECALTDTERKLRKEPERERETIPVDVRFYRRAMLSPAIAEYDKYSEVIFLNAAAMRIFQDRDTPVSVLKIVTEEELPKELGIQWRKLYLPLNKFNEAK